jgi:hypothetical protein
VCGRRRGEQSQAGEHGQGHAGETHGRWWWC